MLDFFIQTHRHYITFDFGLAAFIIFLIKCNQLSVSEILAGVLVFTYYLFDLMAASITYFNHFAPENAWFYNIAQLLELSFFFYIYTFMVRNQKIIRTIKIIIPIFVVLFILNLCCGQGFSVINTFTILPAQAIIALLAFLHLRQCVEATDENPFYDFSFWFSIATLVSNAAGVPVLATINWFNYRNTEVADRLYIINDIIYCTWFALISIGLLWTKRQPISSFS